jgi:hypothetical protein
MATVKKGLLTPSGKWWKHLRRTKRLFWKSERQAVQLETSKEAEFDDSKSNLDVEQAHIA